MFISDVDPDGFLASEAAGGVGATGLAVTVTTLS